MFERTVIERIAGVIIIVVVVVTVFGGLRHADFVALDDRDYVAHNPLVSDGFSLEGLHFAFARSNPYGFYWQPLTWLSHMLDCQLFGLDPGAHHMVNVVLHAANASLLFLGLSWLTGSTRRAAAVALLFAVHPLTLESVAWISERKNLLSTLLLLATAGVWAHYTRRPSARRYCAALLVAALGLLTKPMLVTLPLILLLLDLWPLGRWRGLATTSPAGGGQTGEEPTSLLSLVVEKLPFVVLAITSALVTLWSLAPSGNVAAHAYRPLGLRLANAAWSVPVYLGKLLAPRDLSVFYPFPHTVGALQILVGVAALIIISAVAVACARRQPALFVGWLWFLGTLVPVSGIVQAGLWPAYADRWTYVPMIGVLVMVVWPVAELLRRTGRALLYGSAITVVMAAGYATVSMIQAEVWQSSHSLFSHAMLCNPENWFALSSMADRFTEEGRSQESIVLYERSLLINPAQPQALTNLAQHYSNFGRQSEALPLIRQALELEPGSARAHNAYGIILARMGLHDQAAESFSEALKLDPTMAEAAANLDRARQLQ